MLGMPECNTALAMAVVYMAKGRKGHFLHAVEKHEVHKYLNFLAPKSIAVYSAIKKAQAAGKELQKLLEVKKF
mgnify:CR=1 FL=1|tara:strand:+ start:947 stop:1165 length:219 start_codon:yes stop_codon:yes gene_type:complete